MSKFPLGILASAGRKSVENIMFVGNPSSNMEGIVADSSGNIYGVTNTGDIIAVNSNGELRWARKLNGVNLRDCLIDSSGKLLVAGNDGNTAVFARYSSSGTLELQRSASSKTISCMTLDENSNIYFGGSDTSASQTWMGGFSSDLTSTLWSRRMGSIGNPSSIAWYNNRLWMTSYYFSGGFIPMIWAQNQSGQQFLRRYSDPTFGAGLGPSMSANSQYLYQTVTQEISGTYYVLMYRWNGQPGSANPPRLAYQSGNSIFSVFTNETHHHVQTSAQILRLDSNTLSLNWQRNYNFGFINSGGIHAANTKVYVAGQTNGFGIISKLPNDGTQTGTYGDVSYSVASNATITPNIPTFTDISLSNNDSPTTWNASSYTSSTITPTLTIEGA